MDGPSPRRAPRAGPPRTRLRLSACCFLALAILGTFAHPAHASGERSVRFEVRGPPSCADDARLSSEVRARTERAREVVPGETPDLTLRVRIDAPASTGRAVVKGELVLTDSHGVESSRQLTGESCEAVVSGLALVAALAIDPHASTAPLALTPPRAVLPPPPPPPAPDIPPPLVLAARTEPPPVEPPETSPAPATPPTRWHITAGLDTGILGVGAPGVVATGGIFADIAREPRGAVSPSLRLEVQRSLETTVSVANQNESAALTWTFARAEACPLRLAFWPALAIRPCALVDIGALSASASGPANALSPTQPWAAAGGLARLEWVTALSRTWGFVLEANAGIIFPIVRQSFLFDGSTSVYQAPSVTGLVSVGAGVRFP
jgi:hypothetical protein